MLATSPAPKPFPAEAPGVVCSVKASMFLRTLEVFLLLFVSLLAAWGGAGGGDTALACQGNVTHLHR